jgi:ribonucleoside-diphosphate reductase beta chain
VIAYDAMQITVHDPFTDRHRTLVNAGYSDRVVAYVDGDYSVRDSAFSDLLSQRVPLRMRDTAYDYRETYSYLNYWGAEGYGDGMTTPLFANDGRYVGLVNISTATEETLTDGVREFMAQHPEAVNLTLDSDIIHDAHRAIELEQEYIAYCLKDGPILGYSVAEHVATAQYFANMRLGSVGLPQPFDEAYHAFPWMSEQMELKKETNFFEKRVTEYQSGGALIFDDDSHDHANPGWSDPLQAEKMT